MTNTNSCINRVADHTDVTDCGAQTLPGHRYCISCRVEQLSRLAKRVSLAEAALTQARQQYEGLLAEGVAEPETSRLSLTYGRKP